MIIYRSGWITVTLIVLFLLGRTIAGTWIELEVAGETVSPLRIIAAGIWILILVGIVAGLELARFAAIILLALGSAFAVTVLLDPAATRYDPEGPDFAMVRNYIFVFIGSNLVIVPLLAFSKPVRSYFSKLPNPYRRR